MSKSRPYVIYKTFWLGTHPVPWTEYATIEEAQTALDALQSSPSGKYFSYDLPAPTNSSHKASDGGERKTTI